MSGGRVLIVDDEESVRFTLCSFLEDEGHLAEAAATYEEAYRLLGSVAFDLVFIDIILDNGTSGIDLLRRVKEVADGTEVIIITGAPTVDTASRALRLGALDYIVKPIRQDTLLKTTALALKHKLLREAKETYRLNLEAIFRSVRDGIITVNEHLEVVEANPAAAEICGVERDNATGRPLSELVRDCCGSCLEALAQTVGRREPVDLPCVECGSSLHPDQVVSITATPLLRQDGTSSGGVLVVRNRTQIVELERCLAECREMARIIGRSAAIEKIRSMIRSLADVQTPVLITGESGTGKELVADALHAAGNRCGRNLVKINCAALSEGLLESELFGHVRGAFTGAVKDKVGRFQRAHGGSIFLDEIGEMTPSMQLRLLRVLETMEFERVGDSTPIRVDVRVIAATNRDLHERVQRGEFREDLYFRLKVVEIHLPPLRERRDDIPLLVHHFVNVFNRTFSKSIEGVSDQVMELFQRYHWPGNVRQLEHVLEHAFVLTRRQVLTPEDLPADFMKVSGPKAVRHPRGRSAEVRAILAALEQASHNKSEAARLLGISRRTLYRKLEENQIVV
ncbi:MAG TPA: sigma 54-interacting transcriptional regulator [Candidatus Sulfomarinibacteraceae bacterium]|nr:sigma 54-interacting transcriptional regulator [Candidatus Sulfomarinibacteraceae bacterium]